MVPHPKVSDGSAGRDNAGPSVVVRWEFQRNGKPLGAVTRKWASHVRRVVRDSGDFSGVVSSGADCTLHLTMNNVVDSYAGAIGQGVLSGLTLGLIGTKVTDNYVCTATLTKNGESAAKEYKYGLISTSGLIVSGVEGVEARGRIDDAFEEILDQFLLKCVADFRKDGSISG